jgi:hypothetical protein
VPAHQAILSEIAACALLFGQTQNFGNAPDPQETKRGEKMVSQGETVIGQNERMISLSRTAIGIAVLALLISLVALLVSLWSTFHHK